MESITEKKCSSCKILQPLSEFTVDRSSTTGFSSACKSCQKVRHLKYKEQNREKVAKQKRAWEAANRERVKDWRTEYDKKYYISNKDKILARGKAWTAANPEKKVECERRRRARRASNGGCFTAVQFDDLCESYGRKCLCCGRATKLQADHVVPVCKGGGDDISNIQPLCSQCNQRKGTKATDYRY